MAKRRSPRRHFADVYTFRDTDLMAKVGESGAEGATAAEIAAELGMDDVEGHHALGRRFSWMRRYGMLTYDEKAKLWLLSEGGERVLESRARAALVTRIESVPDEEMVEVMAHVTSRYRLGDPMVANMLRREFVYGTNPRSRAWGNGR
jgi:hypothetical protein